MSQAPPEIDLTAYPILFVDDEQDIVESFLLALEDELTVHGITDPTKALDIIEREGIAVLVTDQRMPKVTGVELIGQALERKPDLVPIILTGYSDPEALVTAINLRRIFRYVPKPWDPDEMLQTIEKAIESAHLSRENARLTEELWTANALLGIENRYLKRRRGDDEVFASMIGTSEALKIAIAKAQRVADADATVLLEGPTGTGKELFARALHYGTRRKDRAFVPINCAAVTETILESELFGHARGAFTGATADRQGAFEVATGGTLFLDEIGEMPLPFQAKLLRVLQEREITRLGTSRPIKVDVRVVGATHRDLEEEVRQGRFRQDLFYRLNVIRIRIPSLAERREDIPELARHFLAKATKALGRRIPEIAPEGMAALMAYDFQGNIRELENTLARAVLLCDEGEPVTEVHLFDRPPVSPDGDQEHDVTLTAQVHRFERQVIKEALDRHGGNKTHAARELGASYRGLLKIMDRLGMTYVAPDRFRAAVRGPRT